MVPIPAAREDLAIDFANTLSWRGSAAPVDELRDLAALCAWLGRAGLPHQLLAIPPGSEAEVLFVGAIGLREAIYRIFAALAGGGSAAAADLESFNRVLGEAPSRSRLLHEEGVYAWAAEPAGVGVPVLLAPVLWSAADLLARAGRLRIRRCANPKCLWLFIDRSKAGTRRWCDMASCGNRAKAQRHYSKTRHAHPLS